MGCGTSTPNNKVHNGVVKKGKDINMNGTVKSNNSKNAEKKPPVPQPLAFEIPAVEKEVESIIKKHPPKRLQKLEEQQQVRLTSKEIQERQKEADQRRQKATYRPSTPIIQEGAVLGMVIQERVQSSRKSARTIRVRPSKETMIEETPEDGIIQDESRREF